MRLVSSLAPLLLGVLLAACSDASSHLEDAGIATRDSVLTLGAHDVRIVSTDGQFEMAVVGERVVMRMSDLAVQRIRRELDTAHAAPGVGGWIERRVKGTVQRVLDKQMVMPVSAITDARYEDGELRLTLRGGGEAIHLPGAGGTDGRVNGRFARADAERFVAAIRAARERRS